MPFFLLIAQARASGPGLLDFFWRSGPMAKVVLAILVFFSLVSWGILLGKLIHLRRASRHSKKFLEVFHQSVGAKLGNDARRGTHPGVTPAPSSAAHGPGGTSGVLETRHGGVGSAECVARHLLG